MAYDIARKIRAMVAKAGSTSSSEEADSIMQMVRLMLERHGISLLTIDTAMSDDPVGITENAGHWWRADSWTPRLADAVAYFYGVRIVHNTKGNKTTVVIVGRESCRAAFIAMFPYLQLAVKRLATKAFNERQYRTQSIARSEIGRALTVRLWRLYKERTEEPRTERAELGLNMLVPLDHIDIMLERRFPDLDTRRAKAFNQLSRYAVEAANSVSLAEQMAGTENKGLTTLIARG